MKRHTTYVLLAHAAVLIGLMMAPGAYAQLLDHPYHTSVRDERTALHFIDAGMIRRAHAELREMDKRLRHASAQDATPFRWSDVERASGNRAAADRSMENFLRNRPNSPQVPFAWVERGLAALEADNDEAAIGYFDHAAAAAADRTAINDRAAYVALAHYSRFWQAASLARTGRYQEALDAFRLTVDADSTGVYADRAWYAIGQVYERNGDTRNAIDAFDKVRTTYPGGSVAIAARIRQAQNLLTIRRPERALDVLTGIDAMLDRHEAGDTSTFARQFDADAAREEVLLLRAEAATLRNRYAEALDSSRAFLQRYPASTYRWHVHLHAGYNALALERAEESLGDFQMILDSVANDDDRIRQLALLYNAVALKRAGRVPEAVAAFTALSVQTGYPFQAQALVEAGQAAYEAGDYDKARKTLERAEREASDAMTSLRAQILLGATLVEQQQWSKAAAIYDRVEARADEASEAFVPNRRQYLAEARLKRGISLVQAGETQKAITALTDFLGNHPEDLRRDEATFWLAESMYRRDLLKNAQELYSEIIDHYGASSRREEALYGLAWTHFRKREFERSVAVFGEMLQDFPQSRFAVDAYARRGDGYYVLRQFRAAAEQYSQAAAKGPGTDEGQYSAYQKGQAMYRLGATAEAESSMKAFVGRYPKSRLADDAMYLVGWLAFQRRDYQGAVSDFRKLIDAYPDGDHAVRALYTIADAQYNMAEGDSTQVETAMATYRSVISKYPSHQLASESAKNLQGILLGMDRHAEAVQIADDLINANPQSQAAEEQTITKANIFYSGKNYANAAAELEAYMKKYPSAQRQDEALYLLGKTYLNMNDVVQASNAFTQLDKRFPQSEFVPESMLDMAIWYDKAAQASAADSVYKVVLRRFADDTVHASRAGFERAVLLRQRGDTASAIGMWAQTADAYRGTEYGDQSRYQVAMHYRRTVQYDSARYHLGILAQREDNPQLAANALYDIGFLFVREKRFEEAIVPFERVRDLYAGNEDWYTMSMLGLGESYEALKRNEDAILVYQAIVNLRPEDDFGKSAQARLKRLTKGRK